jgi:hypothetical protein
MNYVQVVVFFISESYQQFRGSSMLVIVCRYMNVRALAEDKIGDMEDNF